MENIEKDTFHVLKKSFDWLDKDQDGKVSLQDIEQVCEISTEEAHQLFDSISTKNKDFIEFQDFYEGVSAFPILLNQFKSDQIPNQSIHLIGISELLQFSSTSEVPTEVQLVKVSEKLKDLSLFPKKSLILLCNHFFQYLNDLHDTLKNLQEIQSCKNIEQSLNFEALLQEKNRLDKNYETLLSEHKSLEKTMKSLEDQLFLKEKELKHLQLKTFETESDLDSLSIELDSVKTSLKLKEKTINELTKKLTQTKTLTQINKVSHKLDINEVKTSKTSKTPKGFKTFQIEPVLPSTQSKSELAKDQILKNLKNQLTEKISAFQQLESKFLEVQKEKQELREKVKILSLRSRHCSEEEEFQFETIESLRDELLVIDSAFVLTTRPSLYQSTFKDSAVQVDLGVDKKKGRFSCFRFFT